MQVRLLSNLVWILSFRMDPLSGKTMLDRLNPNTEVRLFEKEYYTDTDVLIGAMTWPYVLHNPGEQPELVHGDHSCAMYTQMMEEHPYFKRTGAFQCPSVPCGFIYIDEYLILQRVPETALQLRVTEVRSTWFLKTNEVMGYQHFSPLTIDVIMGDEEKTSEEMESDSSSSEDDSDTTISLSDSSEDEMSPDSSDDEEDYSFEIEVKINNNDWAKAA